MLQNKNSSSALAFKSFSSVVITSLFCLTPFSTLANNIAVNHSQLEQYISLQNEEVLLRPAGEGVFLSFDFDDNWSVNVDYQTWQDKEQAISPVSINLALTSFGGGLSYVKNNWYASTNISFSEDDVSYRANQKRADFRQENTQVTSLSGLLGYNWLQGNWIVDLSIGAQYADWSIENTMFNDPQAQDEGKPPEEVSITKQDSSSINAGISAVRYWELTQEQGILAGAMFSWSYQYSGDARQTDNPSAPPRLANSQTTTSRNIGTNTSRPTSGDDSYGQLTAFLSYDINSHWSVAIDTSVEIYTDNNNQSWTVGINYYF